MHALAPALQSELEASVVVINRPGANEAIAGAALARSRNDGYTLMLADVALLLNSAVHSTSPGYDVEKDFTYQPDRLGTASAVRLRLRQQGSG